MYKGSFKNFFLAKTTHRLPKVIAVAVSSCLLVAMVSIDASASGFGSRDSNSVRSDVVSTLESSSSILPTTPPATTTSTASGGGGGGGGPAPATTPPPPPTTTTTTATSGSAGTGNPGGTGGAGSGGGTGSGGASSVTTTTAPQSTTTTASPPSSTTTPPALGVYAGTNNQAGVNNFAATTGAHVTLVETYLPWEANTGTSVGWSYLTTPSTMASWLSTWSGTSDQMVIAVPMVALNGSGSPEI